MTNQATYTLPLYNKDAQATTVDGYGRRQALWVFHKKRGRTVEQNTTDMKENQPQQQRQILLPRPRRLRPRDPWPTQLKLQQTGEGAGKSPVP